LQRFIIDLKILDPLVAELKRQNDSAVVIVGAAQLDDLLAQLLERFLLPDLKPGRKREHDSLLGPARPLGSFSVRITMALRLGLVGPEIARSLHIIRQPRNAFAHRVQAPDLDDQEHRAQISALHRPIPSPTFWKMAVATFGDDTPANQLRAVLMVLVSILAGDLNNISRVERQLLLVANHSALTANYPDAGAPPAKGTTT
jgi:hypothetical protein